MKNNIMLFIVGYLFYMINLSVDFGIFKFFLYFLIFLLIFFTNTQIEYHKLTERKTKIEYSIVLIAIVVAALITDYFFFYI
jgi:hypothetical protein